jgi:hypothetical protein
MFGLLNVESKIRPMPRAVWDLGDEAAPALKAVRNPL